MLETLQALCYWYQAVTAVRKATCDVVGTSVSMRCVCVSHGWYSTLTVLGSQRVLFCSKHFVNALIPLAASSWLCLSVLVWQSHFEYRGKEFLPSSASFDLPGPTCEMTRFPITERLIKLEWLFFFFSRRVLGRVRCLFNTLTLAIAHRKKSRRKVEIKSLPAQECLTRLAWEAARWKRLS